MDKVSTLKILQGRVSQTLDLAEQLCVALDTYWFIEVSAGNPNTPLVSSQGRWVGDVPTNIISRASYFAPMKRAEVIRNTRSPNMRVLTPVESDTESTHLMGGAGLDCVSIGCGKWDGRFDRLFALILLYHTTEAELTLHHAGFAFPDSGAFAVANGAHSVDLLRKDSGQSGHVASYFRKNFAGVDFYREHLLIPGDDGSPTGYFRHWDVVVKNPAHFLWSVASAFDQTPELFVDHPDPNAPAGAVWITDAKKQKLGVMARRNWWEV